MGHDRQLAVNAALRVDYYTLARRVGALSDEARLTSV